MKTNSLINKGYTLVPLTLAFLGAFSGVASADERSRLSPSLRDEVLLSGGKTNTLKDLVSVATSFLSSLIPLVFTLALLYFLWGMAQFIYKSTDEAGREAGKQHMAWGILGLFVMVTVWGLVTVLANTFDLNNALPSFPSF